MQSQMARKALKANRIGAATLFNRFIFFILGCIILNYVFLHSIVVHEYCVATRLWAETIILANGTLPIKAIEVEQPLPNNFVPPPAVIPVTNPPNTPASSWHLQIHLKGSVTMHSISSKVGIKL